MVSHDKKKQLTKIDNEVRMNNVIDYKRDAYKRGTSCMASKEKELQTQIDIISKQIKEISDKLNEKKSFWKKLCEHPLVAVIVPVVLTIAGWVVVTIFNMNGDISKLTEKLDYMESELLKTGTHLSNLDTEMASIREDLGRLDERVNKLEEDYDEAFTVTVAANNIPYVGNADNGVYELKSPSWNSSDIIATDINDGTEYSADFLAGKRLLIPYTSGNQEIVFCGQFNKNNHWDKNCIINVYVNNKLILIMDAEYDDGNLSSYRQVLNDTTRIGEIWAVSKREHNVESNSGRTWNYRRDNDYTKEFKLTEVEYGDVISVEEFASGINSHVESYYNGCTSDGKYNDETGDAYLVRYAEDGTVKTLYVGRFKKGEFHDETGNAWEIVFDSSNNINRYFYYGGIFEDGQRENDDGIEYLTQAQINEKISEKEFDCELNWYYNPE